MELPGDYNSQLTELTAKLSSMVAERLFMWCRNNNNMSAADRKHITDMIENNLPIVISNTIAKSPSLYSANGVKYMEQHLEDWADSWARKFIEK
jgi:hypothetical protein